MFQQCSGGDCTADYDKCLLPQSFPFVQSRSLLFIPRQSRQGDKFISLQWFESFQKHQIKFNECKHQDFYLLTESPKGMTKDAVKLRQLHAEEGGGRGCYCVSFGTAPASVIGFLSQSAVCTHPGDESSFPHINYRCCTVCLQRKNSHHNKNLQQH